MSQQDTTAKRLSLLKAIAGMTLFASVLVSFLVAANEMMGAFASTSLSDPVSAESKSDESINHILTINKAAVPVAIVAFFVWVACRCKLRAKRAITTNARDGSAEPEN